MAQVLDFTEDAELTGVDPMLSLCMIVRDEERNLYRYLPGLLGVADEIVVVDTGSRDGSRLAAAEMGARVIEMTWRDDFSEARNLGLAHATQPWILILDADETLSESHFPLLRLLVSGEPRHAYRFVTRHYVTTSEHVLRWNPCHRQSPDENSAAGWYPGLQTRLFPNRPEVRFRYNVCERIEPGLREAGIPIHAAGAVGPQLRRAGAGGAAGAAQRLF
ncbi:glycosyltransferase family 2 protein [bacterium]|nr:glycosyltransferase family 2 protein [bacterium]